MIVENDCGMDTLSETININIISVEELNTEMYCHIFPNPNSGTFTLQIKNSSNEHLQLSIYNTLGQKIKEEALHITTGNYQQKIELTEASGRGNHGIYWLQISGKKENWVKKLEVLSR